MGVWQGWNTVTNDRRIAPLEENTQPAPKVGDRLCLVLPSVPSQGSSELLHLSHCAGVPTTKGLGHQRQEGDALSSALLLCPIYFPGVGMVKGMASSVGSAWQCCALDGRDDGDPKMESKT